MKQCVYIQNGCCALMNNIQVREPDKCHCILYSSELYTCEKCGQVIVQHPMFYHEGEEWYCTCARCVNN